MVDDDCDSATVWAAVGVSAFVNHVRCVMQIGRAGRGSGGASALVLLRDADMLTMHSLKHSCDCDAVATKRILEAVLGAAHAASAREASAGQKKRQTARSKRARTTDAAGKAAKPAAKRKRPSKAAKVHAVVAEEPAAGHAVAASRGGACRAGRQRAGKGQQRKAHVWSEDGGDSAHSGDSDSEAATSDSGDEYAVQRAPGVCWTHLTLALIVTLRGPW